MKTLLLALAIATGSMSVAHRAVKELPGSHAIFLSHPKEVAALIEKAARASE